MCFEDKMRPLVEQLRPEVLKTIDSAEEAQEMISENITNRDSQVAHMATLFFEYQDRFGIREMLKSVGTHEKAKLSHLREAVVTVLGDYIEDVRLRELSELLNANMSEATSIRASA